MLHLNLEAAWIVSGAPCQKSTPIDDLDGRAEIALIFLRLHYRSRKLCVVERWSGRRAHDASNSAQRSQIGRRLDGCGFAVRKPNATGSAFAVGYVAKHEDGRKGFVKALDYTDAIRDPDAAKMLQAMTQAYLFEKALCEKCAHLSKIVQAIGSGAITLNPNDPFSKVEYLIFELADEDIRSRLDAMQTLDLVFLLRTLHHIATGLSQLHQAKIAHQDLKPSNVLVYSEAKTSKICDLGRAWDLNHSAPHDSLLVAGDQTYAPIEAAYGFMSPDYRTRRFGCDMYHLGSLAAFLFTRAHMGALVSSHLAPEHRPWIWGGTYAEVLPFVQAAFEIAIQQFAAAVPPLVRLDLRLAVNQLCDPDPARRSHPMSNRIRQFSFERYISLFDRLAHVAEVSLYHTK